MIIPISAPTKAYPNAELYQRDVEKHAAMMFKKLDMPRHYAGTRRPKND
jgi:hypothetical protein